MCLFYATKILTNIYRYIFEMSCNTPLLTIITHLERKQNQCQVKIFLYFENTFFFLTDGLTQSVSRGRGRGRARKRSPGRRGAECGALHGARSHDPETMTLADVESGSQPTELPGCPRYTLYLDMQWFLFLEKEKKKQTFVKALHYFGTGWCSSTTNTPIFFLLVFCSRISYCLYLTNGWYLH